MSESRYLTVRSKRLTALIGLMLFLGAFVAGLGGLGSLDNSVLRTVYPTIHIFMELGAIVVAMIAFAVGWHHPKRSLKTIVLTSALFVAAWMDAGHMLSFPGMPPFITPSSPARNIEFWLAGNLIIAAALMVFAFCSLSRQSHTGNRYIGLALAATLVLAAYTVILYFPGAIPPVMATESGHTTFRLWAESLIIGMYLLAALCLLPVAWISSKPRKIYVIMAALILALGEITTVFYDQTNGFFSLVSRGYKLMAYLLLCWAIFTESIQEPYERLKASEQELAFSENKFRSLVEFAPDAVLLMDESGKIINMNQLAEAMFTISRAEASGVDGFSLVPLWEAGADVPDIMCQRVSGEWFPAEVSRGQVYSPEGQVTMVVVRDISERKRLQQTFVDQLTHDALTGLPNRTLIIGRLEDALAHAQMAGHRVAVHLLDVDFFKKINDMFGHSYGDEVLRECVTRLSAILPPGDILARHGGDEFIIVQNNLGDTDQAAGLAAQLLTVMRMPFHIHDQKVFLSASIGLVVYPKDELTGDGLLQKANVAMSSAKQDGRDSFCFYTPEMDASLREHMGLESYLHNAVQGNELLLEYQPKVCFGTGTIVGVEALVRWQHPVLGLISPARFIPVAEASGLIAEIGFWVLKEACHQVGKWQAMGLPPLRVSVNLSARQFHQADLPGQIRQVLEDTDLPPSLLELELTESTVMRDTVAAIAALQSLKDLGVQLSIDDFGTGYSSLSYLKQFPIDVLKIDRSFVKDVMSDPNDAAIARAIVALAHGMELAVVAEGVESLEQAQFLFANGCKHMQGFYFSRPLPPDVFGRRFQAGVI